MWTHEDQLKAQRQSMEKQRFGHTREEILKAKGARCAHCGTTKNLQIDHINGGGRHMTEMGMMESGKTHNMNNMQVLCDKCMGEKDRKRGLLGLGYHGEDYHRNHSSK